MKGDAFYVMPLFWQYGLATDASGVEYFPPLR